MPVVYKGVQIPVHADPADGPANFASLVDTLSASDALKAVDIPVGTLVLTIRTALLTNWLFLDGSTVVNGQTLYPVLWGLIPVSWQAAPDIHLPDARSSFPIVAAVGVAMGTKAGSATKTLTGANLPAHTHNVSLSTSAVGDHTHGGVTRSGGGGLAGPPLGSQQPAGSTDPAGNHSHSIAGPTDGGPGLNATPFDIMPPSIAFNLMMKAA